MPHIRVKPQLCLQRPSFDRAIADFSVAYADQNERDYQALLDARDSGRITVEEPTG